MRLAISDIVEETRQETIRVPDLDVLEARDIDLSDGVEQAIKLNWGGGRSLAVDGDVATGGYDGALQGSGGFRIAPNNAEVRLKDFRSRKKGSP